MKLEFVGQTKFWSSPLLYLRVYWAGATQLCLIGYFNYHDKQAKSLAWISIESALYIGIGMIIQLLKKKRKVGGTFLVFNI